tara:strand:- start:65 stop:289 length:225 start_codon:yes stop_codon:yes gene_type:complete
MLKKNKFELLQLEYTINILRYHIELLVKLFPTIIKENNDIRPSTAHEINRMCTELELIINKKNILIDEINKMTK